MEAINDSKLENIKVKRLGYSNCFVKHGSVEQLEKEYGLDIESIVKNMSMIFENVPKFFKHKP